MRAIKRLRARATEPKLEDRAPPASPAQQTSSVRLASATSESRPGPLIGECIDARHPTLQGRARVRWAHSSETHEAWIPMLMTVTVRAGDRVLLLTPINFAEPVIVGVLDGFAPRPERPKQLGATLELQRDEAIRVHSCDGQELLELSLSEAGPLVKLLTTAVQLSLPGALNISAESIALQARRGEVVVSASDDVVLEGTTVRLN